MMVGSRMDLEFDAAEGRDVGSKIGLRGRVLGIPLAVDEVVITRTPPTLKVWETTGTPNLFVIGHYRMGFEVAPRRQASTLRVFIDYAAPEAPATRWLGQIFGDAYARWCTTRMTGDAAKHFSSNGSSTTA